MYLSAEVRNMTFSTAFNCFIGYSIFTYITLYLYFWYRIDAIASVFFQLLLYLL